MSAHCPEIRRIFWCTQDPSETERTRGASGDVAGDTRGILSPLVDPTRLYLLFCPGILGLWPASGGVFDPLPFMDGKWLLESDLPDEPRVVGGDDLSNHELSVDELLFPLVVCCERCSSLPSLLEEELWSEEGLFAEVVVLKEAFDRRRRLRSLRKEGIARCCV